MFDKYVLEYNIKPKSTIISTFKDSIGLGQWDLICLELWKTYDKRAMLQLKIAVMHIV